MGDDLLRNSLSERYRFSSGHSCTWNDCILVCNVGYHARFRVSWRTRSTLIFRGGGEIRYRSNLRRIKLLGRKYFISRRDDGMMAGILLLFLVIRELYQAISTVRYPSMTYFS